MEKTQEHLEQIAANMQPSLDQMRALQHQVLLHGIAAVYGGKIIDARDLYVTPPEQPNPPQSTHRPKP